MTADIYTRIAPARKACWATALLVAALIAAPANQAISKGSTDCLSMQGTQVGSSILADETPAIKELAGAIKSARR